MYSEEIKSSCVQDELSWLVTEEKLNDFGSWKLAAKIDFLRLFIWEINLPHTLFFKHTPPLDRTYSLSIHPPIYYIDHFIIHHHPSPNPNPI